jgi:hypothetical protein
MTMSKIPHPNKKTISQFFWLQFIQPGNTHELPSSTNWMKLWRYITLDLKQSSVWFIPNFNSNAAIKVLKKRWSRGDLERIIKGDYRFYDFNAGNIQSITATVIMDYEKCMKDWLIIKCDYDFVEKNREQLQKIAKNLNTRVVMIFSSNN